MSNIPPSLRSISHYVKIANENSNRDPVIYYWCLYYAVQTGMTVDKSSPDAKSFLVSLLETLETVKKQFSHNEAITNEVVAQAHIEDYALKIFNYADAKEKEGVADERVAKAFYSSGYIFDVLGLFGEGPDESIHNYRKYAKWKAMQIYNCLKSGTPYVSESKSNPEGSSASHLYDVPSGDVAPPPRPAVPAVNVQPSPAPASAPAAAPCASTSGASSGGAKSYDAILQAQKLTKFALSALEYEDANAAIENLRKALALLEK